MRTKSRLYVIRNGRTTPEFSVTKATLPAIAGKAIGSLIDTQAVGDLYRLYVIAKRDGIDYNVIDIPAELQRQVEDPVRQQLHARALRHRLPDGPRRHAVEEVPAGLRRESGLRFGYAPLKPFAPRPRVSSAAGSRKPATARRRYAWSARPVRLCLVRVDRQRDQRAARDVVGDDAGRDDPDGVALAHEGAAERIRHRLDLGRDRRRRRW